MKAKRGTLKNRCGKTLQFSDKYGDTNVRIFGSTARGIADAERDIDLLVSFDDTVGFFAHAALTLKSHGPR